MAVDFGMKSLALETPYGRFTFLDVREGRIVGCKRRTEEPKSCDQRALKGPERALAGSWVPLARRR
jgi:hypothetical protein